MGRNVSLKCDADKLNNNFLMRTFKLALLLFLIFIPCVAQLHINNRNSFLSAGYLQVNEDANFGLVFKGPALDFGMSWEIGNEHGIIIYEYELGGGIIFSRDIPALGFYLKPFDLAYIFRMPLAETILFVGPSFKMEYNYNLYPELQSGFDYWFTNSAFGVYALCNLTLRNSSFRIKFNSSVAGFTSRQENYRDPYFYDIGFKYAIRHLNQDLTFASFNSFCTSTLELLWKPKADSRLALGYALKYSGYYQSPEISMVTQSFKLIFSKK